MTKFLLFGALKYFFLRCSCRRRSSWKFAFSSSVWIFDVCTPFVISCDRGFDESFVWPPPPFVLLICALMVMVTLNIEWPIVFLKLKRVRNFNKQFVKGSNFRVRENQFKGKQFLGDYYIYPRFNPTQWLNSSSYTLTSLWQVKVKAS